MDLALEGLLRACETMFMLTLEKRGEPVAFNPSAMQFGGRISVIRDDGCWDLALFGCADGCKNLTRAIYVMEDDETPTDEEVVEGDRPADAGDGVLLPVCARRPAQGVQPEQLALVDTQAPVPAGGPQDHAHRGAGGLRLLRLPG